MTKDFAQVLWKHILEYAIACQDLGGEGNSGEFHDAADEKFLEEQCEEKFYALREAFIDATGFQPVIVHNGDVYMFKDWNAIYDDTSKRHIDYINLYRQQHGNAPDGAANADVLFPIPAAEWGFVPTTDADFRTKMGAYINRNRGNDAWCWRFPHGQVSFI